MTLEQKPDCCIDCAYLTLWVSTCCGKETYRCPHFGIKIDDPKDCYGRRCRGWADGKR